MTDGLQRANAVTDRVRVSPHSFLATLDRVSVVRLLVCLPRAAAITAGVTVLAAIPFRQAWPTGPEWVQVMVSLLAVTAVMALPSRSQRLGFGMIWIVVLVCHGLPTPERAIGWDFRTFYDGARLLFVGGQSPYGSAGTTAFPFPTFALVWLLSLAGRLGTDRTFVVFILLEILLLATVFLMTRRSPERRTHEPGDMARDLVLVGLLLHPTMLAAIGVGNSSIVAGALMAAAVWVWQCGSSRRFAHAGAALVNLACMVKPQLMMAAAFFLTAWLFEVFSGLTANGSPRDRAPSRSRAAAIGRLIIPWCIAIMGASILIAPSVMIRAYVDFPTVAGLWHTAIAVTYPNNYAPAAILAKALARFAGVPVLPALAALSISFTIFLLAWNVTTLRHSRADSPLAAYPWVFASLLWSSLVWEWYLALAMVALLGLARTPAIRLDRGAFAYALWFAAGIAFTMVISSFAFTVGVFLLYCYSHAVCLRDNRATPDGSHDLASSRQLQEA